MSRKDKKEAKNKQVDALAQVEKAKEDQEK
jgi:hypothetical protein